MAWSQVELAEDEPVCLICNVDLASLKWLDGELHWVWLRSIDSFLQKEDLIIAKVICEKKVMLIALETFMLHAYVWYASHLFCYEMGIRLLYYTDNLAHDISYEQRKRLKLTLLCQAPPDQVIEGSQNATTASVGSML